jgi:hypothetical protein
MDELHGWLGDCVPFIIFDCFLFLKNYLIVDMLTHIYIYTYSNKMIIYIFV